MPPTEKITQLMQWLAEKAKNTTSSLNIKELCRQFKEETGTSVAVNSVEKRIGRYRQKIHEMDEFDMETKVKLMFALSAPIDAGVLIELKKVADVKVDDEQRIIHYKKKDGQLELSVEHMRLSINEAKQRSRSMIQFLAEKTKTVDTPMVDQAFLKEFKENDGCHDSIKCLGNRYTRMKKTIFESSEFDKNTKVKMMFISHTRLSDDILEELQKDATVELDEQMMIKKYKANDGSMELKGDHSQSARIKTAIADMKKKRTRVVADSSDSEEDEEKENRKKRGRKFDQAPTSLPTRSSERIKKPTIPTQNTRNSSQTRTPNTKVNGRNKARSSSSEDSDDLPSDQEDDYKKSMTKEDDSSKVSEVDNTSDSGEDMDYSAPVYNKEDLEHVQERTEIPEVIGEEKKEAGPSSSAKIETMNLPEFLAHLRTPTLKYAPSLVPKTDEKIKKLEKKDHQIRYDSIKETAKLCIQILHTPDEMDPYENAISLMGRKSDETATSSSSSVRRSERIKNGMSGGRKRAIWVDSSSEESEDNVEESIKSDNDATMDSDSSHIDNGEDGFAPLHNKENMKHVLAEPNSEVTKAKKEEAGPSSSVKIETMSLLELLNHLRSPIVQYTPNLAPKIDEKIQKLEEKDKQIPLNTIIESLESCIQILNTPDEMDSDEDTISLPDFFYRLGMALLNIPHPSMDDFHVKMRKLATSEDKLIPIEHIRFAMKETLNKIIR